MYFKYIIQDNKCLRNHPFKSFPWKWILKLNEVPFYIYYCCISRFTRKYNYGSKISCKWCLMLTVFIRIDPVTLIIYSWYIINNHWLHEFGRLWILIVHEAPLIQFADMNLRKAFASSLFSLLSCSSCSAVLMIIYSWDVLSIFMLCVQGYVWSVRREFRAYEHTHYVTDGPVCVSAKHMLLWA